MIRTVDKDGDGIYEPNLDCVWTIIAPEGKIIRLQFFYVNMEGIYGGCNYDVVEVSVLTKHTALFS